MSSALRINTSEARLVLSPLTLLTSTVVTELMLMCFHYTQDWVAASRNMIPHSYPCVDTLRMRN